MYLIKEFESCSLVPYKDVVGVWTIGYGHTRGVNSKTKPITKEKAEELLRNDISEFEAICEISDSRAGYNPELSYGSHFFQDLVEAGILYNAIFENEKTIHYHPELLDRCDKRITGFDRHEEELKSIVKVFDVSEMDFRLCNDMKKERILCFME